MNTMYMYIQYCEHLSIIHRVMFRVVVLVFFWWSM